MILWYVGVRLEKYLEYLTEFYDILDLELDSFYHSEAGIPLKKSQNLLELSAQQLVIQSSLASSISLSHVMLGE